MKDVKKKRIRKVITRNKVCKDCFKVFYTSDTRNNFCSSACKTKASHKTKLLKYGKKGTTGNRSKESYLEASRKLWSTNKESMLQKRRATCLLKYGVSSGFNTKKSIAKRKDTIKLKYGVNSPRLVTTILKAGFKNYEDFSNSIIKDLDSLKVSPYSDTFKELLNTKYSCSYEILDTVLSSTNREDLLYSNKSSFELEVSNLLLDLNVPFKRNTRPNFMKGLELDFLLEKNNLAIECHGLAFHSERAIYGNSTKKEAHLNKFLSCNSEGIRLIQIFEDEWRDKRSIIASMIKSRLGISSFRAGARKLTVKEVNKKDASLFLINNHLSGTCRNLVSFGLFEDDKQICQLTLRKPWNKNYGDKALEIARFCSLLDYQVSGGFSKLFKVAKVWTLTQGFDAIFTYADCRFGTGNVYLSYGFNYVGRTKPNYFYENKKIREDRFKHRKNNDKDFTLLHGNNEIDQNKSLGWFRIFDAGSEIYVLKIKNP